jgi:hypothetical protein
MPLRLKQDGHAATGQATLLRNFTFGFCLLFGLAMIVDTQTAGDGTWYWYATFFHNGRLLYSGMHLALQPLFVLETSFFLTLLGKGWLVSKVPAVLHMAAYTLGLLLLVRSSTVPDRLKALLLACAFFVSIDFAGYRFDDYHLLADCFEVYSLVLLLGLARTAELWRRGVLVAFLGFLSGLSATTRLNDGAGLFVGVAISLLCIASSRRILWLLLLSGTAALTLVLVVRLTGDSLHDYAYYSIFHAAGDKGGTGSVLGAPLRLPWNALAYLRTRQNLELDVYVLGAAGLWVTVLLPFLSTRRPRDLWKLAVVAVFVLLPLHHFFVRGALSGPNMMDDLSALAVPIAYGLGLAVFGRFLYSLFAKERVHPWDRRAILLLIPLGQLASSSMSSGGVHIGIYGPLGIMILLLSIASPLQVKSRMARAFAVTVLAILTVHCAVYKYRYPYFWHTYRAGPLFVGREWFRHPEYGPMVVDHQLLQFIEPICAAVKPDGAEQGLLSLPYSYPNYFCAIEPWHGYVQTFYDTSSKETIFGLMDELAKSPPKWIVYQRQPTNLKMHEQVYNQGRPLPHRYLDQMIEGKISSGAWQAVYRSPYGSFTNFADEWILIRTRP